jgi:hypothetical protein
VGRPQPRQVRGEDQRQRLLRTKEGIPQNALLGGAPAGVARFRRDCVLLQRVTQEPKY